MCVGLVAAAPAASGAPQLRESAETGFALPFLGAPGYAHLAPTKLTAPGQLNVALGQPAADRLARQIGLDSSDALSPQQYRAFISGGGVGGDRNAAKMIDACIWILTNTRGRPMYSNVNGHRTPSVLASYGVYVNSAGLLQSPANASAPTRQVNNLIAPGGYVGTWLRNNGATRTLLALYRSAYTVQAAYGFAAQQMSGPAQLVDNTKGGIATRVGMSMAPPLWIVNFALIYIVKPSFAAAMPAYWAPIPPPVANALNNSPTGQVPYSAYASYFR